MKVYTEAELSTALNRFGYFATAVSTARKKHNECQQRIHEYIREKLSGKPYEKMLTRQINLELGLIKTKLELMNSERNSAREAELSDDVRVISEQIKKIPDEIYKILVLAYGEWNYSDVVLKEKDVLIAQIRRLETELDEIQRLARSSFETISYFSIITLGIEPLQEFCILPDGVVGDGDIVPEHIKPLFESNFPIQNPIGLRKGETVNLHEHRTKILSVREPNMQESKYILTAYAKKYQEAVKRYSESNRGSSWDGELGINNRWP